MKDPRLPGRDISWVWSWMRTKEGHPRAGPFIAALPVLAFSAAIALVFIPYTTAVAAAKFLFLAPFPLLVLMHLKGRRGAWSVAGMAIAALPYAALIASAFIKGEPRHIPL